MDGIAPPVSLPIRVRSNTPPITSSAAAVMTSAIHRATQGFAQQAGTYARGRPDYSAVLDAWLRDTLRLGPGA